MGGRGAVAAAVAVWLGLLIGPRIGPLATTAALAPALGLAWIAWRGPDRVGTLALVLTLVICGAARGVAHQRLIDRSRAELAKADGLFRLEGRVVGPPLRQSGEALVLLAVDRAAPSLLAGSRVRLWLPAGTPVEWGDRLRTLARLEVPPAVRNPGGYDARAAAAAAAVTASGRSYAAAAGPGLGGWPRATVGRWRRAIERRVDGRLEPEARELVAPLLLGDRSAMTPELAARLRASGLIHLLALSGLHVAWMAAVMRGLAALVGCGPRGRAAAGGVCGLAYIGLAGPVPSLARAAATEVLHAAARATGREFDPVQALAVTALALLTVAPGWAADLGFQLSCAATLGLVAVGPALTRLEGGRTWVGRALATTLAAQLAAAPLLIERFHAVSWVAPLANLAAVPLAGLLLNAAWLAVALDGVAPGLGAPCFGASEVLARGLTVVCAAAARAPRAMLAVGHPPALPLLAGAGAALLMLCLPGPRDLEARRRPVPVVRRAGILLGGAATGLALLLGLAARPLAPPPGAAWLVVLDVGQGDALALGFADGWWLVDAGPRSPRYDAGESVVLPFFRWAGVRRLEALVITHDDSDHDGGVPAVLRGLAPRRVWMPPSFPRAPGPRRRFDGALAARGFRLRNRPPVRVLWPPPADSAGIIDGDNAASMVLEVGEEAGRMLLLADVDSAIEARLPATPATLVKVAHHGSGASSGATLLGRARPRWAAVSCGRHNPFGHPAPGALRRLEAAGARIQRTDRLGALWYEATGAGVRPLEWRRSPGPGITVAYARAAGGPGAAAPRAP